MLEGILVASFVARLIVQLYILVLWARFILDWVRALNPAWRPRGFVVVLIELVFTITDPPIRFIRKLIPPLRIGSLSLDFGWMITLIACWVILAILP
ncbi:YggT family protein [Klugiella xanthotipulae]|uniref:YggT family protein n=1 Tax=Klugiella xanthotipulae TaxID=244735 RepID=A0A543HT29_9MICO|nr:YggT family protein [Klugiella xanthotipulae]TQM61468.1 YggT family protein [Klugiella xanthotipulae]